MERPLGSHRVGSDACFLGEVEAGIDRMLGIVPVDQLLAGSERREEDLKGDVG